MSQLLKSANLIPIARTFGFTALTVLCVCSFSLSLNAQDPFAEDPFAGGEPVGNQPAVERQADEDDEPFLLLQPNEELIEKSIADSNPTTAIELVRAINTLLDIESNGEAKVYFDKLVALPANDSQYFSMHRSVGSPFFLRLATESSLQPDGKVFADKVLDAAYRYAYNPSRLSALVKQLTDDNIYVRSDAYNALKSTGDAGAAAIIEALQDPDHSQNYPRLRTALRKFGNAAEGPLLGALLTENEQLQAEATHALGFVNSKRAVEALYRPLVFGSSDNVRAIAVTSIRRQIGRVPDMAEIEQLLYKAAREYTKPYRVDVYDAEVSQVVWREQNGSLQRQMVRKDVADHMMAAQLSEVLYRMRPNEPAYQTLYLVAALQAMKLSGGIENPIDPAFSDSIRRRFSSDQISDALGAALEGKNTAAAIGACEVLQSADEQVLESAYGRPSPLARALSYGDQRVTYAALKTISSLSISENFAGSSSYTSALAYLGSASGIRKALVGHVNRGLAHDIGEAVRSAGYSPIAVGSSRQLYNQAISDPDIELILISDTISKPDYLELVQVLRRDWRTRRIPIGLMYSSETQRRIEHYVLNDELCSAFPLTTDPSLMARLLDQVRLRGGLDTLGPEQRGLHARWCVGQMAQLTQNDESPIQYDFSAFQASVAQGLYDSSVAESSAEVLGQIGTRFAQKQLIGISNQSDQPIELRKAALEALATAFKNNGVLLNHSELEHQYDLYNASEHLDEESRNILSSILDLLEKKSIE